MDCDDERETRRTLVSVQINLKRKREHNHDELIDLAPAIHGTINPHLFSTALERLLEVARWSNVSMYACVYVRANVN